MNREEIVIEKLKSLPEMICYQRYIDKHLARDFQFDIVRVIERLETKIEELKKERDSLKCCGNCGNNKLYSNGQYEIEQMCDYDHECKTSPDISMSLIDHWKPIEPPKEDV